MIDVKGLKFSYTRNGEQILKGFDFSIKKGEIFGFLGPSGERSEPMSLLELVGLEKDAFSTPGSFDPLLLLISVVPSSVFFTLAGLALAVRVKSINGYIIASPFFLTPFILPLFGFMKLFNSPIYCLLPGYSSVQLLAGAYNGISFADALYSIILIAVWDVLAFVWASRLF
ncbi:MAG: hypothetical protein ACYCYE_09330, partial [Clostridia bacterium]